MPVHNGLTVDAEAVTATQTLIVVKDFFIHLFAQHGPGGSTSSIASRANQTTRLFANILSVLASSLAS